jgi:hypothetical protein
MNSHALSSSPRAKSIPSPTRLFETMLGPNLMVQARWLVPTIECIYHSCQTWHLKPPCAKGKRFLSLRSQLSNLKAVQNLQIGRMPFDVDGTGKEITPPMIFAIGLNYVAHAKELNKPIPEQPIVFAKSPNTLNANGSPIVLPPEEPCVDYEGELAVIIGPQPCRSVHRNEALKYATLHNNSEVFLI